MNKLKTTTEDFYLKYPYKSSRTTSTGIFIKQHDRVTNHPYSLTNTMYKKIIDEYFALMLEELLTTSVTSLHNLGEIVLSKYKSSTLSNYKRSKELSKRVTYNNLHSFGYTVRVMWNKHGKGNLPFKNRNSIKFRLLKRHKTSLAEAIRNTNLIDKIHS